MSARRIEYVKPQRGPFFSLASDNERREPCESCGKPVGAEGRAFPIGGGWAYACDSCARTTVVTHPCGVHAHDDRGNA